jgi:hypothetical protein
VTAAEFAADGHHTRALDALERLLGTGPPSVIGWTIAVDPGFRPLTGHPGFARVLARLAERAR